MIRQWRTGQAAHGTSLAMKVMEHEDGERLSEAEQ